MASSGGPPGGQDLGPFYFIVRKFLPETSVKANDLITIRYKLNSEGEKVYEFAFIYRPDKTTHHIGEPLTRKFWNFVDERRMDQISKEEFCILELHPDRLRIYETTMLSRRAAEGRGGEESGCKYFIVEQPLVHPRAASLDLIEVVFRRDPLQPKKWKKDKGEKKRKNVEDFEYGKVHPLSLRIDAHKAAVQMKPEEAIFFWRREKHKVLPLTQEKFLQLKDGSKVERENEIERQRRPNELQLPVASGGSGDHNLRRTEFYYLEKAIDRNLTSSGDLLSVEYSHDKDFQVKGRESNCPSTFYNGFLHFPYRSDSWPCKEVSADIVKSIRKNKDKFVIVTEAQFMTLLSKTRNERMAMFAEIRIQRATVISNGANHELSRFSFCLQTDDDSCSSFTVGSVVKVDGAMGTVRWIGEEGSAVIQPYNWKQVKDQGPLVWLDGFSDQLPLVSPFKVTPYSQGLQYYLASQSFKTRAESLAFLAGSLFVKLDKDYLYDMESEKCVYASMVRLLKGIPPAVVPFLFRIKDKAHRVEFVLSEQCGLVASRCPFPAILLEEPKFCNVTVTRFNDGLAVVLNDGVEQNVALDCILSPSPIWLQQHQEQHQENESFNRKTVGIPSLGMCGTLLADPLLSWEKEEQKTAAIVECIDQPPSFLHLHRFIIPFAQQLTDHPERAVNVPMSRLENCSLFVISSSFLGLPVGSLVAEFEKTVMVIDKDEGKVLETHRKIPEKSRFDIKASHVTFLRRVPHNRRAQVMHCDQLKFVDVRPMVAYVVNEACNGSSLVEIEQLKDGWVHYTAESGDVKTTLDKVFSCDHHPWTENHLEKKSHNLSFEIDEEVECNNGRWKGSLKAVLDLPWMSEMAAVVDLDKDCSPQRRDETMQPLVPFLEGFAADPNRLAILPLSHLKKARRSVPPDVSAPRSPRTRSAAAADPVLNEQLSQGRRGSTDSPLGSPKSPVPPSDPKSRDIKRTRPVAQTAVVRGRADNLRAEKRPDERTLSPSPNRNPAKPHIEAESGTHTEGENEPPTSNFSRSKENVKPPVKTTKDTQEFYNSSQRQREGLGRGVSQPRTPFPGRTEDKPDDRPPAKRSLSSRESDVEETPIHGRTEDKPDDRPPAKRSLSSRESDVEESIDKTTKITQPSHDSSQRQRESFGRGVPQPHTPIPSRTEDKSDDSPPREPRSYPGDFGDSVTGEALPPPEEQRHENLHPPEPPSADAPNRMPRPLQPLDHSDKQHCTFMSVVESNRCRVGFAKWFGRLETGSQEMICIECISENLGTSKHEDSISKLGLDPKKTILVAKEKAEKESSCYLATCNMYEDDNTCSEGDLVCVRSDGLYFLDGASKLEGFHPETDKRFHKMSPELLPFFMFNKDVNFSDKQKAIEAASSGQLDNIGFSNGEKVLVSKDEKETGDPEEELEEMTIEDVKDGRILVEKNRSFAIDQIFAIDYPKRTDLPWMRNILPDQDVFHKNDLVSFNARAQCHVGRLKWMGSVPWREDHVFGIECLKESPSEMDDRFLKFVRVMDAKEGKAFIANKKDHNVLKINSFFLRTSNEKINGENMRGSLWCECENDKLHCLDESQEVAKSSDPDFMTVSPEVLPFLLEDLSLEERCDVCLSGQLDGIVLKKGERVLVRNLEAKSGDPEKGLVEREILHIKSCFLRCDENVNVGIENILRKDYLENPPPWHRNLLDKEKEVFQKNNLVSFNAHDQCHVGRLRWMGSVPWREDYLFGIECLKESPSDGDDRFLKFVRVMDVEEGKAFIAGESEHSVQKISSFFLQTSNKEINGRNMHGSLWCECENDKLHCLDILQEVAKSSDQDFMTVSPEVLPFLLEMPSLEERCDVCLSDQLNGIVLEKGERVLVRNPGAKSGDPEKDLVEREILDIKSGFLDFDGEIRLVGVEDIFRRNYLDNPPSWNQNLLDSGKVVEKEVFQKNNLVSFIDAHGQCHVGRLKWMGSVPWSEDYLFGIECLKKSPSDGDDRFLKFVRVMDVEEGKALIAKDFEVQKVKSFFLRTSNKEINGRNMHGSLWCESENDKLHCLDESQEVAKSSDSDFMTVLPEVLPFLLEVPSLEKRCDVCLSGQLDGIVLKKGERVLVRNPGADSGDPEKDLVKREILDIKSGFLCFDGNRKVSIQDIFRRNYLDKPPFWHHNLLDSDKETFHKNDLVSFIDAHDQCHVGRLKWMGSAPWREDHLFGIECLKKSPSDGDDRFLKFVRVMDVEEGKAFNANESDSKVEKMAAYILKPDDQNRLTKRGTLWCKRSKGMFCLDENKRAEFSNEMFAEVLGEHLAVLQRSRDLEERLKAALTGQLRGIRFTPGEEVFVTRPSEKSGNPTFDFLRRKVSSIKDGAIVVDEVGGVSVDCIYSDSYPQSYPEWAKTKLGKEGFQMLAFDQELHIKIPQKNEQASGKVKWMGKLPWLVDDLMVGIELDQPLEKSKAPTDSRYLEYVQILQCDANKAYMIPYSQVPDEHKGGRKVSLFLEEELKDFPKDSRAVFIDKADGLLKVGTIKWTGRHRVMFDGGLAVIVLDKRHKDGTNGYFLGELLSRCPRERALLISTEKLFKVEQFKVGDHVALIREPKRCGVVRWIDDSSGEQRVGIELARRIREVDNVSHLFDCKQGFGVIKPNTELKKISQTEYDAIQSNSAVYPIDKKDILMLCGQPRGIQGDCNSCYLDTLIFSSFAFSSFFEKKISREQTPNDHGLFEEAKEILLKDIVYPLRRQKFVSFKQTKRLRKLLSKASGQKEFLNQTRDIPECMDVLFGKLLSMEPLLDLGNGTHYNGVYTMQTLPVFNDVPVLTSQLVMECSAMAMDFHLKEFPRVLMLQLPREKSNHMSLIPSLTLDLNFVLKESGEKKCVECKCLATKMCQALFDKNGLASTFLCDFCAKGHQDCLPIPSFLLSAPGKRADVTVMHLSSVICIELSHYNCFSRCGDHKNGQWVFFDSMADQEMIDGVQRCQPRITKVDAANWIRDASRRQRFEVKDYSGPDGEIYQRLFKYPYCLIYEREDI